MVKEYLDYYDKTKKFIRIGKRDPSDLFASDWQLVPSGGYRDAYAKIHSNSLDLTLSYDTNTYPLVDFMNNEIINGRLELCRKEDKSMITIDNSSDLVFTSKGLIPYVEYEIALDKIDKFKDEVALGIYDLNPGSVYASIDKKLFVYLGIDPLTNNPKIQEFVFDRKWARDYHSNVLKFKKEKNIGKTGFIDEIEYSDIKEFSNLIESGFIAFKNAMKQKAYS